jgi:hypothetical protein
LVMDAVSNFFVVTIVVVVAALPLVVVFDIF